MHNIFQKSLIWLTRRFMWFVVIVAILATANFMRGELSDFESLTRELEALRSDQRTIREYLLLQAAGAGHRMKQMGKASRASLVAQIRKTDAEIKRKKAEQEAFSGITAMLSGSLLGNGYLDYLKRDIELQALEQERAYLSTLVAHSERQFHRADAAKKLRDLYRVHVTTYSKLKATANRLDRVDSRQFCASSWKARVPVIGDEHQKLAEACRANARAAANYKRQKKIADGFRLPALPPFAVSLQETHAQGLLDQAILERERSVQSNWAKKASTPVFEVVPSAALIVLTLILAPLGIKAFTYYFIAPLASRRPAIELLPRSPGELADLPSGQASESSTPKASSVSLPIKVDPLHELLIHPDYLQSSSVKGQKKTKWMLDWSYPMASLASGMVGLTRIHTDSDETFVISATKDPLSEVGMVSIPDGSALVFRPRSLVGILQQREKPVRIESVWRFNSLHAWLTLQFRYLIFHGPVRLVVKGCRGIRIEKAGAGRSINQGATLGFSANLQYSTLRCETFGAYLMGKDELFNDHFAARRSGFYVYEEMPNSGAKYGIFGRGIEGILDSFLKVIGV
jgi:hypothetical protein